jgi:FkbM family methyltransferase
VISSRNPLEFRYSESVVISYSQNQEDVVLFRLVELIPEGIYVDVGAAHPVLDNVTYALYKAGWHGLNIEPMKREADLLKEIRPRDITCETAAGDAVGRVTLYAAPIENRGATTADKDLVTKYTSTGQSFEAFEVDVVRLDQILEENKIEIVHILKIDVEGAERAVLEGASISKYRPWVLVIEATRPKSTEDVSSEWENLVLEAGYSQTLFDGLNKFYVRNDMPEVMKMMSTPANVFDRWAPFEVDDLRQQAVALQKTVGDMSENFSIELEARNAALMKAEEYVSSLEGRAERAEEYALSLEGRAERAEEYALSLQNRFSEESKNNPSD